MDPNKSMQRIYHGFLQNDWHEAKAGCDELLEHFTNNGVPPDISKIEFHVLVSMAGCFCTQHIEMKKGLEKNVNDSR